MNACISCEDGAPAAPSVVCQACLAASTEHVLAAIATERAKRTDPDRTRRAVVGQ